MQLLAFSFGWKDLIDILLVAGILYYTYRLLRCFQPVLGYSGVHPRLVPCQFCLPTGSDRSALRSYYLCRSHCAYCHFPGGVTYVLLPRRLTFFFMEDFSSPDCYRRPESASTDFGNHTGMPPYGINENRCAHRSCRSGKPQRNR